MKLNKVFKYVHVESGNGHIIKDGMVSVEVTKQWFPGYEKAAAKAMGVSFPLRNLDIKKGAASGVVKTYCFKDNTMLVLSEVV